MDELLAQFLIEAPELIAQAGEELTHLARDANDRGRIDRAFRAVHTLKGSVAIFDMAPAGRALHAAEDLLQRVRAGSHALDEEAVSALIAVLDETARWIDAMERVGALPTSSGAVADRLVARMALGSAAFLDIAEDPVERPWLRVLLGREAERIDAVEADLVAFRYEPDSECFFRGDDPLAIVGGVPGLVAFAMLPGVPCAPLESYEPFRCTVVLEGLSDAPLAQVRAAFRLVADQLDLAELPKRARLQSNSQHAGETSQKLLRVESGRIDALADGVGELLVASNALLHVAQVAERTDPEMGVRVRAAHGGVERAVNDMRRAVMAVRMVSLGPTFRRVPRMVREVAEALGKLVRLDVSGETTEVDKAVADALHEPLLHIIRNAVDHGIELPVVRNAAGKPEVATLLIRVRREADHVLIAISDDGAGIDPVRVRDTAVARGIIDRVAAEAMDDAKAIRLILAPGFSTAATVTSVSGRGVGLDAVKTVTEQLGGTIDISSSLGAGTTVSLRFPLNAIMTRLLVVRVGDDRYGVPIDWITETASIPSERIVAIGSGRACVFRDRTLPVVSLAALLGSETSSGPMTRLLVTEAAAEPVGVIVDAFEERIDGLVRPKTGLLANVAGVAGTTLLGDGGLLLVLDIADLVA